MTGITIIAAYLFVLLFWVVQPARVIDGDSVVLNGGNVRLAGIDAPEIGGKAKCEDEKQRADAARERLARLLAGGVVAVRYEALDKYGRPLVRLVAAAGDVGDTLVREGLAREYQGGKREGWCGE